MPHHPLDRMGCGLDVIPGSNRDLHWPPAPNSVVCTCRIDLLLRNVGPKVETFRPSAQENCSRECFNPNLKHSI